MICVMFMGISIYAFLWGISNDKNMFGNFACLLAVGFMLYVITANVYNRVIFFEDKFIVTGQLYGKKDRTQFREEILYSDISDIKMVYSNKNSKKKYSENVFLGTLNPKLYYEFILKNGKSKWIAISFYSKKQRKAMLDIINGKTNSNFVYEQIDARDNTLLKKKKKSN